MTAEVVDQGFFRNVLGRFCTGITVVTTVDQGTPVGFTCQSFAALSLDPPLVLFCPTKRSGAWHAIHASGHFCINVLSEKQENVSAKFGSRTPDKFGGIQWRPSRSGSPILADALAFIDCTVYAVHEGGDHFVVYGAVQELWESGESDVRPLLFYRGAYAGIDRTASAVAAMRTDAQAVTTANVADGWI
ncbi:3-hydroxy-9,10-secoandrosta-1,3,5(10)-triene-9,17-dione monooxygenase reductase subunit [Mycobacterium sp. 134]|uniref:3-hydroxy-9,10-secoandrosta-1,3,5(10)-triene-9, 17-dione monooxygenase reductase subunit n=1 Tax=unclassified Mycobacterium TaxID=2642494 RepID=UPI0008000CB8|nr:3-hydroxy-9,10-secoandrosta-1,3,5(10)-triene-9,17-dione monooxygenase reductase subunit [Mycobacterium sp. E802]OBG80308.1 monooxygenase [Mycobacterium sp. E802]